LVHEVVSLLIDQSFDGNFIELHFVLAGFVLSEFMAWGQAVLIFTHLSIGTVPLPSILFFLSCFQKELADDI
jgi:hypothetical protein